MAEELKRIYSNPFYDAIKEYLDTYAKSNPQFAEKYSNPKKSIEKCCEFIVSEVQKMNVKGLDDGEVYYLARHYYEEENLDFKEGISCKVVVNKAVELTPEEIEKAKQDALEEIKAEEMDRIQKEKEAAQKAEEKRIKKEQEKAAKKLELEKKKEQETGQMSMFDDLFGEVA
ncbi:PcfK-like family protein [Listeria monocytogenes]